MTTDSPRRRAARRRRAAALLAAGSAVVVLLVLGTTNPTHHLLVHDLLDHPVLLGVVAAALLVAGVTGLVDDPQRRVAVGVMLAGSVATVFGLVGLVVSSQTSASRATWRVPGPGALVAVVTDDGRDEHPVTRVAVQDLDWSPGAHRYDVACVQSAPAVDGHRSRVDVRWVSRSVLRVADGGRVHDVALGADGAATTPLRVGLLCGATGR